MSSEAFEGRNQQYFQEDIRGELGRGGVSPEIASFISTTLSSTFLDVRNQLGITVPIVAKPSDIITHAGIISSLDPQSVTYAVFAPSLDQEGKLVRGDLVLMRPALVAYGRVLDHHRNGKVTPWELIASVAHELRHSFQWQTNPREQEIDGHLPYHARASEYDAIHFSYDYLRHQKVQGTVDYIERHFVLQGLRNDMKDIRKEKTKLGLK